MSISFNELLGCGMGGMGARTWGYDPNVAQGCCKSKCPQPVFMVPVPSIGSSGAGSTMNGVEARRMGYMGYRGGFGAQPSGGSAEYFAIDPSLAPASGGGSFSMEELSLLPQARLTPQDQLIAAQGRRRRGSDFRSRRGHGSDISPPPSVGSLPFEIEKHSAPQSLPGGGYEYFDLGLVGERF